jgi:hypothetical protein
LVEELDTFHLRLVDQIHIFHLLANELLLKLSSLLVGGINLGQVLIIVGLELLSNLGDVAELVLKLLHLGWSHILHEVESLPFRVELYLS